MILGSDVLIILSHGLPQGLFIIRHSYIWLIIGRPRVLYIVIG